MMLCAPSSQGPRRVGGLVAAFSWLSFLHAVSRCCACLLIILWLGLPQMNPDVFPLLFGNGVGWVIYACCTRNIYIFAANFTNVMVGMFYVLTGYMLSASDSARQRIEIMTLAFLGMWSALGFAATQIADETSRNSMMGATANVIVLLLFASPLSTFANIIREKTAASINKPFALVQVLNCILWLAYGLSIADVYIWGPNAMGLGLGIIQIVLLAVYGSKPALTDSFEPSLLDGAEARYPP